VNFVRYIDLMVVFHASGCSTPKTPFSKKGKDR
jgi:hypothetical protein